jgi:hypothetical protein
MRKRGLWWEIPVAETCLVSHVAPGIRVAISEDLETDDDGN